jgi:hypothetical protein
LNASEATAEETSSVFVIACIGSALQAGNPFLSELLRNKERIFQKFFLRIFIKPIPILLPAIPLTAHYHPSQISLACPGQSVKNQLSSIFLMPGYSS